MDTSNELQISLEPYDNLSDKYEFNLDKKIYDLNSQLELLTPDADNFDYLISIASGLLCGSLDILWTGDFDLGRGRDIANDEIEEFVKKIAQKFGCKNKDLKSCIAFLERKFPIPSDGNTDDFGGGLQHHLRDFAHHPTVIGLVFSLLTQFTYKSYGTDVHGAFHFADVPEKSRAFIGDDVVTKILYGTIIWFFHLVSDVSGSSSSTGKSNGTGIPGPILSLAKELSVLPAFKDININDRSISVFISKLFNGTLLAKHDETGAIIKESILKIDLRGEFGIGAELERQAIPVIANDCIVRAFYFIRHLAIELRKNNVRSLDDMKQNVWDKAKPANNPTIARMLTIATGIFTTVDIGEAIVSQKYWVSVNYVGVGRFAVAIGQDVVWCLRARNIKKIRQMYEDIKHFTYTRENDKIYERIGADMMDVEKLGLTVEQTEILYNLEYYKTLQDIQCTNLPFNEDEIKRVKLNWLEEWKQYMTQGFSKFLHIDNIELHWFSEQKLIQKINENEPRGTWFKLTLLEAMLFEPYFPLSLSEDKKGNSVPDKKYKELQNAVLGYKKDEGDRYLDKLFTGAYYYTPGYIKRFRKCYNKVLRELNEVLKTVITTLSITAGVAIVTIATAGALAPAIAVALVGSNFAGLSGAALTSACLAYLGGGAIAVGGAGMAGGTIAIVGGGAALGIGVGAGVGGIAGAAGLMGKKNTILQSAKLMVSVREIFLNDEHDIEYSNSILEKYVQNIAEIEKGLVELRLQADVANGKEKKALQSEIKKAEESVEAMKIARKSMAKFISSFETGMAQA